MTKLLKEVLKRLLLTPLLPLLPVTTDGGDSEGGQKEEQKPDYAELSRILSERLGRVEAGVVRDYLSRLGLSEEQQREEQRLFAEYRKSLAPSSESVREANLRAESAEREARKAALTAEARVQMALAGIREECFGDVLALAGGRLSSLETESSGELSGLVREVIDGITARIPGLTSGQELSAGSTGNFPRRDAQAESYSSRLAAARACGDNALAAAIISAAAGAGIMLR